jgi:hypothetical protein
MTTSEPSIPLEAWTDDRIREAFIYDGGEAEFHDPINGAREQRRMAGAIFDAWLAARDAEIKKRALDEAIRVARKPVGNRLLDFEARRAIIIRRIEALKHGRESK